VETIFGSTDLIFVCSCNFSKQLGYIFFIIEDHVTVLIADNYMLQYLIIRQLFPNKLNCNKGLVFSFFNVVLFVRFFRVTISFIYFVAELITEFQLLNLGLNIYIGDINASLYVDDLKFALV